MRSFICSFATRLPLLLATTLTGLIVAGAAASEDFDERGLYVGVSGVYSATLFQEEALSYGGLPSELARVSDSKGVSARLGYRLMSWIALEIQYEWLDTIEFSNATLGQFAEYNPQTVTANVKLFLPSGSLQPYLLVGAGVGFWELDTLAFPGTLPPVAGGRSSGEGFTGRAGLGLNFHMTDHVALNLEGVGVLNTTTLDPYETDFDKALGNLYYFAFSAGITYRF